MKDNSGWHFHFKYVLHLQISANDLLENRFMNRGRKKTLTYSLYDEIKENWALRGVGYYMQSISHSPHSTSYILSWSQAYEWNVCRHIRRFFSSLSPFSLFCLLSERLGWQSAATSISDGSFPEAPRRLDSAAASDLISDVIQTAHPPTSPPHQPCQSMFPINTETRMHIFPRSEVSPPFSLPVSGFSSMIEDTQ